MLITGGWGAGRDTDHKLLSETTADRGYYQQLRSAEIYHSARDTPCVLPLLPELRIYHDQDGSLVCGGKHTDESCRKWNPNTGDWDLVTESLIQYRRGHTTWTPLDGSGTYLMGGYYSGQTSEVLDLENNVRSSFPLKYDTE